MAMVDELRDYLTSQSVATSDEIFLDWLPSTPDQCIAIYAEPGLPPELGFGESAGVQFERPNAQVVARAAAEDDATAEDLAWSAYQALAKIQARSVGGTPYLLVLPMGSPSGQVLGRDESQRPRYSFNLNVRKELS